MLLKHRRATKFRIKLQKETVGHRLRAQNASPSLALLLLYFEIILQRMLRYVSTQPPKELCFHVLS